MLLEKCVSKFIEHLDSSVKTNGFRNSLSCKEKCFNPIPGGLWQISPKDDLLQARFLTFSFYVSNTFCKKHNAIVGDLSE